MIVMRISYNKRRILEPIDLQSFYFLRKKYKKCNFSFGICFFYFLLNTLFNLFILDVAIQLHCSFSYEK